MRDKAAIRRNAVLVICASNKMMEADVQGHCLIMLEIMSVAVNKRMLWPSRQRSRMRLKLYIVITTKVKENSKLACRVKEKLVLV